MFNSNFLRKMTKSRFNLRKVATIVACLIVTMMFVACDKTNPDDDNGNGNGGGNGSGKIDTKLVGNWNTLSGIGTTSVFWNEYAFYSNGTFFGFRLYRPWIEDWYNVEPRKVGEGFIEGKWSCSDGKVYITDFYIYVSDTEKVKEKNKTLEYSIFDKGGQIYLRMHYAGIDWGTDYLELPPANMWDFQKSNKSNIIVSGK